MTHTPEGAAAFFGLVDLAAEKVGGVVLAVTDDFFAEAENLLKPGRGVSLPDKFTERGKWMDGWESRRKRTEGYDWCVIALGAPGRIRGLDIDTAHFLGNHPPYASLEAAHLEDGQSWEDADWTTVLEQSPLRPGSQNLFAVHSDLVATHVRLSIFPDGGVARLRVFGDVAPSWAREVDECAAPWVGEEEVDLVSVRNGGLAMACSDSFFGPMNNLIAPNRAANMGGGWESRRRRGPGHDWILLRLGALGEIGVVEIDTNHFKGNFPDRCMLEGVNLPGARITDLIEADWTEVLGPTKLAAHERKFVRELSARGPFTHLRFSIYPDGGVSRLRCWGKRA